MVWYNIALSGAIVMHTWSPYEDFVRPREDKRVSEEKTLSIIYYLLTSNRHECVCVWGGGRVFVAQAML